MNIGPPQLIIIILWSIGLSIHAAKAGEPTGGTWNPIAKLISIAIYAGLYWWGGFFA